MKWTIVVVAICLLYLSFKVGELVGQFQVINAAKTVIKKGEINSLLNDAEKLWGKHYKKGFAKGID